MAVNLSPIGGVAGQFFDNNGNPLAGGKIYTYAAGTTTNQATYTSASGIIAHSNPIILDAAGRVPSGEIWLTDGLQYKFVIKTSLDVLIGTFDNIAGINSNFVNYTIQEEIQTATAGQTVFTLTTMSYAAGTNSLTVFVDGVNQYDGVTYAYVETNSTTVTFTAGLHVGALVKFTTAIFTPGSVGNAADVVYDPAGTGAVPTSVQVKLREFVSVKDFGAIGDGVTDDTVAIQAAVDSFGSNGGTVFFPSGQYSISSTIAITKDNVWLQGDGTVYTTIINTSDTNTAIIWAAPNPATTFLFGGGIRDMRIMVSASLDSNAVGLDVVKTYHWRMHDMIIENHLICLRLNGAQIASITGSTMFTGQYFALKAKTGSCAVYLQNYAAASAQTANVKFMDCTIAGQLATDGTRDPMAEFALLIDSCDTVFFDSCLFQQAETLVKLKTSTSGYYIASLLFSNCFADGNLGGTPAVASASYLFDISGSTSGVTIADISWVGGAMSNSRVDGAVIDQSTAQNLQINPSVVSNIGRWAINAKNWNITLRIGASIRNTAQNAPTAADGGGIRVGTAQTSSSVVIESASISGLDYSASVNGSPGVSGSLGTGVLFDSYGGRYKLSNTSIILCATKQSMNVAATAQTENFGEVPIILGSSSFSANSGSPVIGQVGGTRRNGWLFDASSIEAVAGQILIPTFWGPRAKVTIVWTNAGAGSGDVVWNFSTFNGSNGDNLNSGDGGSGDVTVIAPAQDIQKNTVISASLAVTPGDILYMRVIRQGTNVADTLPNDCCLLAVIVEPT